MRKKFILGKKKAVVTSVLAVVIMCLASTAVPATSDSKAIEIKNNIEKSNIIDQETFEKGLSILKGKLFAENNIISKFLSNLNPASKRSFRDNLEDFTYSDFSKICNILDLSESTRYGMLKAVMTKLIPLYREMKNIVNNDKSIHKINPDVLSMIEQFDSEFESNPTNNPSSDFNEYWDHYEESKKIWAEDGLDNYEVWYSTVENRAEALMDSNEVQLALSFVLCAVGSASVPIVSIIGWVLLVDVLNQAIVFLEHTINGYNEFEYLQWYEIDIIIHVVENTTERNGIDGLWMDDGIEAISTDALSAGGKRSHFTYYLGPAKGTEGHGWYSLENRAEAEGQFKYLKAPCPPGNWTIEIDGNEEYKGSGIRHIDSIPSEGIKIIEIILDQRQ